MNILIATIKPWNIDMAKEFKSNNKDKFNTYIISNKEKLTYEKVNNIDPSYIFIPHWSWKIPEKIIEEYECIIFHMTDLPYGRGGSPLQNLIERGKERTKISAIKAEKELDTGDIYFKEDLCLHGSAEEIFIRASKKIFEKMIPKIINKDIETTPQKGEVVKFKRRKPHESEIKEDFNLDKVYDYIRMLDAEGYPKAFIEYGDLEIKFTNASKKHKKIIADVEIKEVEDE